MMKREIATHSIRSVHTTRISLLVQKKWISQKLLKHHIRIEKSIYRLRLSVFICLPPTVLGGGG
jgi:hypothetical protein